MSPTHLYLAPHPGASQCTDTTPPPTRDIQPRARLSAAPSTQLVSQLGARRCSLPPCQLDPGLHRSCSFSAQYTAQPHAALHALHPDVGMRMGRPTPSTPLPHQNGVRRQARCGAARRAYAPALRLSNRAPSANAIGPLGRCLRGLVAACVERAARLHISSRAPPRPATPPMHTCIMLLLCYQDLTAYFLPSRMDEMDAQTSLGLWAASTGAQTPVFWEWPTTGPVCGG